MGTFRDCFTVIAEISTVIAGIIATGGFVWSFRGRPAIEIDVNVDDTINPGLTFTIKSVGVNPVRDISVYVGSLNDTNSPTRGDGFDPVVNLYRGEVLLFDIVDGDATDWYVQTAANVYQWGLYNYEGLYLTVRYRSPLFSWRTRSVTYVWDTLARVAGEDLKMLKGKKELDFLESICDRRNLKLDQDPYQDRK